MDAVGEGISASRRAVIRGAVTAGALVWAAPVVQVIAPAAHAGSAEPSLSYVVLLLREASTGRYYRVKYEFTTPSAGDVAIVVSAGPGFEAGLCSGSDPRGVSPGFYRNDVGVPGGRTVQPGAPPVTVVASYDVYNDEGGFYAVLPVGIELVDWLVHQGQCCAFRAKGLKLKNPCQPEAVSGLYKAYFAQFIEGEGNQWIFPAAPNRAGCATQGGGKPFPPVSCPSPTVIGAPR